MGHFVTQSKTLRAGATVQYHFFDTFMGALLNLLQIFEYLTTGPFAGLLSATFWDVEKVSRCL